MGLLPRSVRARLTLWYSVMLGLPLIAFAIVGYFSLSHILIDRTDAFLADALTAFSNELFAERRQIPGIEDAIRATVREVRFRDLAIAVMEEDGGLLASSAAMSLSSGQEQDVGGGPLPRVLETVRNSPDRFEWVTSVEGPDGGYRVRTHTLPVSDRTFRVVGVYPLAEVESTLLSIRRMAFVLIPLILVVAGSGGWFLARRSFRPVSAMAGRAAEISASTLHERLPVASDDELGNLARVFNGLLDRLETSFAEQRRFMADASHELRSPTAILRTEADVTLSRKHRSEEEYRESMEIVREAARRLSRVVDDLFLLARADSGHLVMQATSLYLDEIAADTARAVRPLAESREVQVQVSGRVEETLEGDPDLLARLLLNLLDNAVRHSPPGSTVEVVLSRRGSTGLVSVIDRGPGIPREARALVFDRFFQVDAARSRGSETLTSGAGLGLSIGRRIAEMHGGQLDLAESRPGRTEFILTLPLRGE